MSIHSFSMKVVSLVCSAVLVTGAAALAQIQPGMPQQPQTMPQTSPSPGMPEPGATEPANDTQAMQDRAFLRNVLEGGMAEVQLGQLAAGKASSEDVRSFAQMMVDDHTKLGNDMSRVAQGAGVTPPMGLAKKDKEMIAKFQQLSGSQFDDAYIRAMVKDHKNDEDTFKMEAENAAIPAVKQAAGQNEHIIAGHLKTIEQIAQAHGLKGGKSSNAGLK